MKHLFRCPKVNDITSMHERHVYAILKVVLKSENFRRVP